MDLEQEIKELIVKALVLEDVTADQIETDAPLFGAGLNLDSIDALELAMALSKQYGVQISADDGKNQAMFASVRSLADFIRDNQRTT